MYLMVHVCRVEGSFIEWRWEGGGNWFEVNKGLLFGEHFLFVILFFFYYVLSIKEMSYGMFLWCSIFGNNEWMANFNIKQKNKLNWLIDDKKNRK